MRARLDRELGVAPLRETTDLYNAINGGTTAAAVASSPAEPPAGELPLAGRGAEVAQLLGGLRAGALLVIEGESGVGKTRLAAEALAEISRPRAARCSPRARTPASRRSPTA